MLVRRIATVTMFAPLASTAARVCSKSLYLPVPTRRRDEYARPAITSESMASPSLATPDRDHDLHAVAVGKLLLFELPARHDLAVALERDALACKLQARNQLSGGERRFEAARLAVYGE